MQRNCINKRISRLIALLLTSMSVVAGVLSGITPAHAQTLPIPQSITLVAAADTYLYSAKRDSNFGTELALGVSRNAFNGEQRETLLRFDLSQLPPRPSLPCRSTAGPRTVWG